MKTLMAPIMKRPAPSAFGNDDRMHRAFEIIIFVGCGYTIIVLWIIALYL